MKDVEVYKSHVRSYKKILIQANLMKWTSHAASRPTRMDFKDATKSGPALAMLPDTSGKYSGGPLSTSTSNR